MIQTQGHRPSGDVPVSKYLNCDELGSTKDHVYILKYILNA
jgi:hypothetical protein